MQEEPIVGVLKGAVLPDVEQGIAVNIDLVALAGGGIAVVAGLKSVKRGCQRRLFGVGKNETIGRRAWRFVGDKAVGGVVRVPSVP